MRALWQSLNTNFTHTIELHTSHKHFKQLREEWLELAQFADPYAVLDFLHRRDTDRNAKNRILAALVLEAQGNGVAREVAIIMMWLALCPGLDALYRRLWRYFTGPMTNSRPRSSHISPRRCIGPTLPAFAASLRP